MKLIFLCIRLLIQYIFYFHTYESRIFIMKVLRENIQMQDKYFYITCILGANYLTRLIVSLFYLTLYCLNSKIINKYKVNEKFMWETSANWKSKLFKSFLQIIKINVFLIIPLVFISYDKNIDFTVQKPEITFYKIMLGLILYDFMFYIIHRLLHTKKLYWIHKLHHEYTNPTLLSDSHTSIFEVICVAIFPNIIIGSFISMDLYTQCMFIIVSISLGISQHSNYELPFSPFDLIPFCNTHKTHMIHHATIKKYYSPYWTFWDVVFGSAN